MLTHPDAPTRAFPYAQSVHDKASGAVAQRRRTLQLPESLSLAVGECHTHLPNYVGECPDVKRHEAARTLHVQRDTPDAVEAASAETDSATSNEGNS
jgi:hypothetical protein